MSEDRLYATYCRPLLVDRLRALALDVSYERASGDYLWVRQRGHSKRVTDFAGGYGSTLFGHNHPAIVAEARKVLAKGRPQLVQASVRDGAGALGEALSTLLQEEYVCIITNSGTETVEAGIKHSVYELGSRHFWAVIGGFHGRTAGALQLSSGHVDACSTWGPTVRFIDSDDPRSWDEAQNDCAGPPSGAVFEPILGEGGVVPLTPRFLAWLSEAAIEGKFPLIADEIQSGLGRTGSFLASSHHLEVNPDYICLGKSLGGGIAKIGALLVRRERFVNAFSLDHTSTFAEDDFSCAVALKALQVLQEDHLMALCGERGRYLRGQLENLAAAYPVQVADVRGSGLMLGCEFREQASSPSTMIRHLSDSGYLGWLLSGYLLNVHNIRVTPTMGSPLTLRFEPSAYIPSEEIDRLIDGLAAACEELERGDAGRLTGFLVGENPPASTIVGAPTLKIERSALDKHVAFIGHFITSQDAKHFDPSLSGLPSSKLDAYLARFSSISAPTVCARRTVGTPTGDAVSLSFIGLNVTSSEIAKAVSQGSHGWIVDKVNDAVRCARDLGCSVVGLGGYTSAITNSCMSIRVTDIALTSGNALTIGMALRAIERSLERAGKRVEDVNLGILGAPGNIASTVAMLMVGRVARLTLIARHPESPRIAMLNERLLMSCDTSVSIHGSMAQLKDCDAIICATSSGGGVLASEHLKKGVVVCDVSVPGDLPKEVRAERADLHVIEGGLVRLPGAPDFAIPGIPLQEGHVFACMAETLLMGLEGFRQHGSYGAVSPEQVDQMLHLADSYGFALGDDKTGPSM